MARFPVRDSEGLASMLLVLRGLASGLAPSNDFERVLFGAMRAAGANPTIAQRMVNNFDRRSPGVRRRALGRFSNPDFVPQPGRSLVRDSRPHWGIRVPRTLDFRPNSGTTAPDDGGIFLDRPDPQASYLIKYVGFHCDEEVGDQGDFGVRDTSEEVYAITSAAHISPGGSNIVRTEKHPIGFLEYDDVDRGETRLGPIAACWQGGGPELPVSFTVVAFERDYGDPDYYRDEIDLAVRTAIEAAKYKYGDVVEKIPFLDEVSEWIAIGINHLLSTGDDQVDIPRTLILTQQHLERMGRKGRFTHWDSYTYPGGHTIDFPTDLTCHFATAHAGMGGRYVFGFDVDRNPDFVEDPTGGVD